MTAVFDVTAVFRGIFWDFCACVGWATACGAASIGLAFGAALNHFVAREKNVYCWRSVSCLLQWLACVDSLSGSWEVSLMGCHMRHFTLMGVWMSCRVMRGCCRYYVVCAVHVFAVLVCAVFCGGTRLTLEKRRIRRCFDPVEVPQL